jgi:hypothetical protein
MKKSENSRNQGFSSFFACVWKDPDPETEPDPYADPGGQKHRDLDADPDPVNCGH